jgi:hypothetical protein
LRDEKDPSKLYSRLAWTAANANSTLKLEEKAKQTAATLMQRETQRPLSADQERAIDEIVAEAWAKRKELGQL